MLYKTKGIALSYIRFKESSIIAKIYTESFGIQSYIVNGVRNAKSKGNKIALFQPLTLLDLVVYHKGKNDAVHRISEIKCTTPFHSIPFEMSKSAIALFLTEILSKTLKEEEKNEELFQFLENSISDLDHLVSNFENFHLQFLGHYAAFLGFGIESVSDLESELKQNNYPYLMNPADSKIMSEILSNAAYGNIKMERSTRAAMLDKFLFFYKIHIEGLGEIKSLDVLKVVMR